MLSHPKKVLAPLERCRILSHNVLTFEYKRFATLELCQNATFVQKDQGKKRGKAQTKQEQLGKKKSGIIVAEMD